MKTYLEEVKGFLKNKVFIFCLVALAILAYGYAAVNKSISIDDLEYDRYVGSGNEMLAAGRFGMTFWALLQGGTENFFSMDLLAVCITIFAIINLCILFKRVSGGNIGTTAQIAFGCMFLVNPIVNEIWEYTGANVHIGGSFLFTSLSLLLIYDHIHNGSWRKPWALIPAAVMMMFVCAGYESVVCAYIFLVFAILALQVVYGSEKEKKFSEILRQGLVYAGILAIGLVLRLIVHRIILLVMGINPIANGQTEILWGIQPATTIIKDIITGWVRVYLFRSIVYLPLGLMVLSSITLIIIGIFACKKHGAILILPGLGMFFSLFALSILQGSVTPYRCCQVFLPFCAFAVMLVVNCLPKNKKWLRNAALVGFAWLFLHQAAFINYYAELNHVRSQQEAATVHRIGITLQEDFDNEKPVIFVGTFTMDKTLKEAASIPEDSLRWKAYKFLCEKSYTILGKEPTREAMFRKLPETNVQSMLNWAIRAFDQESMLKIFNYYGYDYVPADYDALFEIASNYAEETDMPAYPETGYIKDVGDYIIVHLR